MSCTNCQNWVNTTGNAQVLWSKYAGGCYPDTVAADGHTTLDACQLPGNPDTTTQAPPVFQCGTMNNALVQNTPTGSCSDCVTCSTSGGKNTPIANLSYKYGYNNAAIESYSLGCCNTHPYVNVNKTWSQQKPFAL